ncbi:hypothetical protein GCM10025772_21960 [Ferrimonas gelatinilytica]|uniref:Uncharacterized protein n=1 Tax=Ferrimonas gelatinilytica TaxID=1255257 RepID=A0ABP9SAU8_9GAMM
MIERQKEGGIPALGSVGAYTQIGGHLEQLSLCTGKGGAGAAVYGGDRNLSDFYIIGGTVE